MPRITIAIPFHNEEQGLPASLRSVFAQTFNDWELLLVDDGSTDRSLQLARSVQDARVRVISDGRKRGLPARLNQVVAEARGELIARMDADDVIHPDRLTRELALLASDPALDAVGTQVAYLLPNFEPAIADIALPRTGSDVLARSGLPHATMLGHRRFFQRFPYDASLPRAEDRDLFCRAFGHARFAILPEPLYVIHPEVGNDFLRTYVASAEQNRTIFRRHGPRLVGAYGTARAIAGSYAREGLYRAFGAAGKLSSLVSRRGRPATVSERKLINEALEASQSTMVPGLLAQRP